MKTIFKLINNMRIKLGFLEKDLDKIEKTLEEENKNGNKRKED